MMARVLSLDSCHPRGTSDSSTCANVRNRWAAICRSRASLDAELASLSRFPSISRKRSMKSSKPIRILVVDDHFMVRMGLSASLNGEPDMEVVAEAGNGKAALAAYRKHRPNLVMMDLRLPGMSGT